MKKQLTAILGRLRRHQMYVVLIGIVLLLLITILSLLNYSTFDPQIGRYRDALRSGEYAAAGRYFADDIRGDLELEQQAQGLVVRQLEALKEAFVEQTIDEDAMREALTEMREVRLMTDSVLIDLAEADLAVLKQSLEAFGEARQAELRGDVGEAIRLYSQVQLLDPNYDETQVRLGELRGRFIRETERDVIAMIDREDFAAALTNLREADRLIPGERTWTEQETEILLKQRESSRRGILDQSVLDIENEDYELALVRLENASRIYTDDAEIVKAYLDIRMIVEQLYITRSKAAWAGGNGVSAIASLEEGLDLIPDSPYLATWLNVYKGSEPPAAPGTDQPDLEGRE